MSISEATVEGIRIRSVNSTDKCMRVHPIVYCCACESSADVVISKGVDDIEMPLCFNCGEEIFSFIEIFKKRNE